MRSILLGSGCVAVATGALVVAKGSQAIPGAAAPLGPSEDSVMRFYATWWVAAGLVMVRAAREPGKNAGAVDAIAATTFAGGLARLLAARRSGRPHPLFRALTVLELTVPPILIVARRLSADAKSERGGPAGDRLPGRWAAGGSR